MKHLDRIIEVYNLYCKYRYSIFFFSLLVFSSCKTYEISDLPDEQIIFGNGGGITGATTSYIMLKNGQIFKTNSLQGDTTALIKIKPKLAKAYFEQMTQFDWEKTEVNQPGNTYKFITRKNTEHTYHATWGASGYEPPADLKSLYESLKKELVEE
ncbi:MAG: hypothetical protein AAFP82_09880 [Bacteroidota bacterium]